jgi:hypothetical protein
METADKSRESHNLTQSFGQDIIMPSLLKYNELIRKSFTGEEELEPNQKERSRVKALKLAIAELQILIGNIYSDIEVFQKQLWNKKYKKKEDREQNPYEEEKTDSKKLLYLLERLQEGFKSIEKANITTTPKDDFVTEITREGRRKLYVNNRFYELQEDVQDFYKCIQEIMSDSGMKMYLKEGENWSTSIEDDFDNAFMAA